MGHKAAATRSTSRCGWSCWSSSRPSLSVIASPRRTRGDGVQASHHRATGSTGATPRHAKCAWLAASSYAARAQTHDRQRQARNTTPSPVPPSSAAVRQPARSSAEHSWQAGSGGQAARYGWRPGPPQRPPRVGPSSGLGRAFAGHPSQLWRQMLGVRRPRGYQLQRHDPQKGSNARIPVSLIIA